MKNCNLITIGIGIAAAISAIYLLMTGWYNVPSLDDYGYIWQAEECFWQSIALPYMGWQGRFSTFFMNGIVYLLFGRMQNLIWVTILMLGVGYYMAGRLFQCAFDKCNVVISKSLCWCVAVLTINIGAMAYLEPSTFFWLCALNYTFSTWMVMLLVYALYFSTYPMWLRWTEVIFASLYISGTAENFTPMVILVMGLIWLVGIIRDTKSSSFSSAFNSRKMLFVALAIMCIGFVVMLLAPGNGRRLAGMSDMVATEQWNFSMWPFIKNTIVASIVMFMRIVSRSLYYLALVPVFVYIGTLMPTSQRGNKHIIWLVLGLLSFIVIEVAACVAGTGWYAPPRANSFLSYVIIATLAYTAIVWGRSLAVKWHGVIQWMTFCASLLLISACVYFMIHDQPKLKLYHDEVIAWNQQVEQQVQCGIMDDVVVHPYHFERDLTSYALMRNTVRQWMRKSAKYQEVNVLLMPADLSVAPNDWRNVGVKRYYHANFDIIGWVNGQ